MPELHDTQRRDFLKRTGTGLIAVTVGGSACWLTPRDARAANAPFQVLTAAQARALEAFGDRLLPGAAAAGIAHFIDHHLAIPAADSLLMIRYLDIPPPYAPAYQGGLAALDAYALREHEAPFADLEAQQQKAIVGAVAAASPEGWQGLPSNLFYFIVRADAVDVVYGTVEGFEALGVPYMPHILPPTRW